MNAKLPGGNTKLPGGNAKLPGGNAKLPGGNAKLPGGNVHYTNFSLCNVSMVMLGLHQNEDVAKILPLPQDKKN